MTVTRLDHMRLPKKEVALIALFSGGVVIGFAPIFVRMSEVGSSATAFWRLILALPALWLWLQFDGTHARLPLPSGKRSIYRHLGIAGLCFAGDLTFWHWSIEFTSVANATLLVNMAPIFVTLGAWLLFQQRASRLFLAGMALALVGAILLVGASFRVGAEQLMGDALGLLSALFYAGYLLSVKNLRDQFSTVTIMIWTAAISAAVLLPAAIVAGEQILPQSMTGWGALVGLALVTHVLGQSLITYALAHLPAAFSSVGLLIQPVVATLLAWWLLGESMGPWQAAGGAIVVLGILVAGRENRTPLVGGSKER